MKNKTTLLISLLLASGSALAGQSLLEGATKQLAKDAATSAAPDAVKGAETAKQNLEGAKTLKETATNAPEAVKQQAQEGAQEAVKQKLEESTPEPAKQGLETLKSGKEATEELKSKIDTAPKSASEATDAVKGKAKQTATDKALDLLR
jgi:hypothetical protein